MHLLENSNLKVEIVWILKWKQMFIVLIKYDLFVHVFCKHVNLHCVTFSQAESKPAESRRRGQQDQQ